MAYSIERKESILNKLLPPISKTVVEVAREEGISVQTLYSWRSKAKQSGVPVPGKQTTSEHWSAETKLAVVVETIALSESELSAYCRTKGLYVEQVKRWKACCINGFQISQDQQKAAKKKAKLDRGKIKNLEKQLRYKEKALAETAALLVLRKKLNAFWEQSNEED